MAEPGLDAVTVTARLRLMARLFESRGVVAKGVDMSPSAVTDRLRTMTALSDACRRLSRLRPAAR